MENKESKEYVITINKDKMLGEIRQAFCRIKGVLLTTQHDRHLEIISEVGLDKHDLIRSPYFDVLQIRRVVAPEVIPITFASEFQLAQDYAAIFKVDEAGLPKKFGVINPAFGHIVVDLRIFFYMGYIADMFATIENNRSILDVREHIVAPDDCSFHLLGR